MIKPAFTNKILFALITVVVVVIGSAFFVNNTIQSIVKEIREEAKPDERLVLLKEMMFRISNAESHVMSYGLTKNEQYVDSYNHSINRINRSIFKLQESADNDQEFQEKVSRIDTLLNRKFSILDELIIVQNKQSVDLLIGKVQDKVADVGLGNDQEDAVEEERFFKRVFGNRKKDNPEPSNSNVNASLIKIDRELDRIKAEESRIEIILRAQELELIRADKEIMDEISTIVLEIEDKESLKMQQQIEKSEQEGATSGIIIALFCTISSLLLIIAGYTVYKYIKKNEAYKSQILLAKSETENKNREIMASINYAKRIQNAILPDAEKIGVMFPNSFILYKPKDIVAGDFYWMIEIDNYSFIAVADCTGHGVPGAMVSMSCSSALDRSVKEFGLRNTASILDKCRDLIIETFDQGADTVYDGMDISLCRIDKSKNEIQFAGANNSLYRVNKGNLTEIRANKQPVARYEKQHPFTDQLFKVEEGDTYYLYTDGYADQFGGIKGKKFKSYELKKLLAANSDLDLETQEKGITDVLSNWQGEYDQVDDICIIGFRV